MARFTQSSFELWSCALLELHNLLNMMLLVLVDHKQTPLIRQWSELNYKWSQWSEEKNQGQQKQIENISCYKTKI